jgi:hypothetical protein
MVKLLYFERGGFCIWHKRLEQGCEKRCHLTSFLR